MTRRTLPPLLRTAVAGGCVVALSLATLTPASAAEGDTIDITLLATTDVHGRVFNYDYFLGADYTGDNQLGLARVKTAVDEVRAEKGAESVFVFDNGDAIQGSPLTTYYSMRDPVTVSGKEHPMATAFNLIGTDVQVVGNHEYNYDLDTLAKYDEDLDAELLGANVIDVATGLPYHEPYTLLNRTIDGKELTVGVLGLVTPGVRVWDRAYVEGKLEFRDMVETAREWVPKVREAGADVVVVLAHTGQGTVKSDAYDPRTLEENAANNIAELVPGIDVMVVGHSHRDEPRTVLKGPDGRSVLLTQPNYWARSVSEVSLTLVEDSAGNFSVDWTGDGPTVTPLRGKDLEDSPAMEAALGDEHRTTINYVNMKVADSLERLPAETSRYEDTPIIDFINHVQAETVAKALVGTEYADIPVISQASPFSRTAVFPQGPVTVADMAGLYIYDNTLGASLLTGAQVKDYLEYSARFFRQLPENSEFNPETDTNALYEGATRGIPDYNYDALSGLGYVIDISQPLGNRIVGLAHPDGTPVADDDQFIMAVNNYRQNGGGGYPHIASAPVVYNELLEIRQLLIDWATEREVIDPADFFELNWLLTTGPVISGVPEIFLSNDFSAQADTHFLFGAGFDVFTGDWDGDGVETFGYRLGNTFYFRNSNTAGGEDFTMAFGRPDDDVVVGDWDGDGVDTVGVRRGNTFYLINSFEGGEADHVTAFGRADDAALVGTWADGTKDTLAVQRGNRFYFADGFTGQALRHVDYGRAGDLAVAGDFDGDGVDSVAVRRENVFHVSNSFAGGPAAVTVAFGRWYDLPVAGDWDGDGTDSLGVVRPPAELVELLP